MKEIEIWEDNDDKCNAIIYKHLFSEFQSQIYFDFSKTSKENFQTIKTFIMSLSTPNELQIRREIEDLKLRENESITEFYNRWNTMHEKSIAATGNRIPDLRQCELFLRSIQDAHYLPIITQFSLSPRLPNPFNPSTLMDNPLNYHTTN
jgi:hypothetical protein